MEPQPPGIPHKLSPWALPRKQVQNNWEKGGRGMGGGGSGGAGRNVRESFRASVQEDTIANFKISLGLSLALF